MRSLRRKSLPQFSITPAANGDFLLEGDLTFATLNKTALNQCKFLLEHKTVIIDLCRVGKADSAGLALLLEWLKLSKANGVQLQFNNIPSQLLALAQLSGVEHYLQYSPR